MSSIDDGGPAFPFVYEASDDDGRLYDSYCKGMSLRNYIAIHATDGDIRSIREHLKNASGVSYDRVNHVVLRFAFADAMIAESKKEKT